MTITIIKGKNVAKSKMSNRIKALADFEGVTVDVNKNLNQIKVIHARKHVADILFVWSEDHYIGYFLGPKGGKVGPAFLALWMPLEAVKFMSWYMTLVEISARRPDPK